MSLCMYGCLYLCSPVGRSVGVDMCLCICMFVQPWVGVLGVEECMYVCLSVSVRFCVEVLRVDVQSMYVHVCMF